MFWDENWDDARFPAYLDEVLEEMYRTCNRETLGGPHFLIEHTSTVERPYQYLSSVPMQVERDTVGRYEVEYEGGEILAIPLIYGLNITGKNRVWE
ncbi:MAG: hypothetical protein J6V24_03995, partial [Clostridia bacterium]|nr:hypothetical protein [Clostridia bacterium]